MQIDWFAYTIICVRGEHLRNQLPTSFSRYQIPEDWPYQEARKLFKEPEVFTDEEQVELKWTPPDEEVNGSLASCEFIGWMMLLFN